MLEMYSAEWVEEATQNYDDSEQPKRKVAVLRHSDADGFGAAYAIWKALKDTCELLFIPVQYGQKPPYEELLTFTPDKLFIVDFSYSTELLTVLEELYPDITVIDHHKGALPNLQAWLPIKSVNPGAGSYFFDNDQSGCGLTWNLFHLDESWNPEEHGADELQPSAPLPEILSYVQDRDLWKFELEHSKEINAFIATLPEDFEVWDDFYLPEAYDCGKAIIAFQQRQINSRLKDVVVHEFVLVENHEDFYHYWVMDKLSSAEEALLTHSVPFVNASENISEIGAAMNLAYPDSPFSVSYCDRADGKRSYSLRSIGDFDVSEVARAFGGNGHKNAAGFTLDAPDIF